MATVMVSRALLDEIRAKVHSMKNQEIETLNIEYTQPDIPVQWLVDELWGDRVHLLKLYLQTHKGGNALYVIDRGSRVDVTVKHPEFGRMQVGNYSPKEYEKFVLPPEWRRHSNMPSVNLTEDHPYAQGVIEYNLKMREVRLKYDTIYNQLAEYLNSCPSLNAAVKGLPEIAMYIPREYKDRMERKVERAKTERVAASAENVDVGSLVTAAVAFRIGRTP